MVRADHPLPLTLSIQTATWAALGLVAGTLALVVGVLWGVVLWELGGG